MKSLCAVLALFAIVTILGGCTSQEGAGNYKEPEEGTFKQSSEVPGREGRQRAEESTSTKKESH